MDLIDIGANLTHDSFDHDRDAVLQRAREAGVAKMVVTGASREHSPKALALAQAHPGFLYATAGVHPHHASEYTEECDAELRALHAHPEVVAVVLAAVVATSWPRSRASSSTMWARYIGSLRRCEGCGFSVRGNR